MGGGDLNLKKSWHPSTMRNQEKVWKAEQKNDLEKRKIAELQREIVEERAREDMQKYAEDKGVVEKKDSMKLDWMYKGPGGMVNREEYLLGRSVDKSFELAQQAEKASSSTAIRKNHVDHECLPPSIFTGGNEQVDMARKLQEDPLYAIKKKEIETRSQILKNPVKLKQLREMMEKQNPKKEKKHKKDKKRKKDKKKRKHRSKSSDSDSRDLDALLVAKYNKLKDKLQKADIAKLREEESDNSVGSDDRSKQSKREKHSTIRKRRQDSSDESPTRTEKQFKGKSYGLLLPKNHSSVKPADSHSTDRHQESRSTEVQSRSTATSNRYIKPERKKLTEDEIERKRFEMMDNVKWRDSEREKNVSRYRKEEKEETKEGKSYKKDFLTKQLSYAASQGTVESRIKANINNIQRSGMAMDKNFARR